MLCDTSLNFIFLWKRSIPIKIGSILDLTSCQIGIIMITFNTNSPWIIWGVYGEQFTHTSQKTFKVTGEKICSSLSFFFFKNWWKYVSVSYILAFKMLYERSKGKMTSNNENSPWESLEYVPVQVEDFFLARTIYWQNNVTLTRIITWCILDGKSILTCTEGKSWCGPFCTFHTYEKYEK